MTLSVAGGRPARGGYDGGGGPSSGPRRAYAELSPSAPPAFVPASLARAPAQVDFDGSGSVDPQELLEALDEKRSRLTDEVFKLMDLDGNGVISFDEFAACLVTFCLFTEADIYQFVFDAFDDDEVPERSLGAAPRAGPARVEDEAEACARARSLLPPRAATSTRRSSCSCARP